MSLTSSIPMESLTMSGATPAFICSCSFNCLCVVDAGWITSDLTSPTFARCEMNCSAAINFSPASNPPFIPNVKIDPKPFLRYFFPN